MKILTAKVKFPPRNITTQYGPRVNVGLTTPDGENITLWSKPEDPTLLQLSRGQEVQVCQDEKGKYKLLEQQSKASPSKPLPKATEWTPDEKKALATRVSQHADLLRYCLETSRNRFGDLLEQEESIRALATTLFIQAVR